jgi:MFS family permease
LPFGITARLGNIGPTNPIRSRRTLSTRAAVADAPPDGSAIRPGTFTSLRIRNFRLFAAGLFVSGTGSWVQRIAQDWLVLDLTGSATAVGVTTACQFLPTLAIGLFGGVIADRFPRRAVLLVTQASLGALATALSILTLTDVVSVWHVYLLALGLGTVAAFDNPCRQAFVNELVGPERIRNAIGLISSTFQLGALIGPLFSGVLIGAAGNGVAFAFNAATYGASISALLLVRASELRPRVGQMVNRVRLRDGLRYVATHPRVRWPVVLVGTFGVFIMSLPVTLAAFAATVLHSGAGGYGLLNSVVASGSLTGALLSARRVRRGRLRTLVGIAASLALATMLAAAPTGWAFLPLLMALGVATLLFLTTAQSMVQQTTPDGLRGRVLGVYTLVFIGSGAIGSPLVGLIAEHLGPRLGLLLAGAIPAAVTLFVARRLAHDGHLRLRVSISLVPR